jgi:hypothetical protein
VDVEAVRIEGERLCRVSESIANGAAVIGDGYGFDCGCQLGMRLGATIMVERRLVNIFAVKRILLRKREYSVADMRVINKYVEALDKMRAAQ